MTDYRSCGLRPVRSSLAKRLNISLDAAAPASIRAEHLAEMMLDAVTALDRPLSVQQLYQWHRWLFAEQGLWASHIRVGQLRGEQPMQVVSGRIDRPTLHFEAPPRAGLEQQMDQLVTWFNQYEPSHGLDPLVRAAITHLWLVTLHPFDDGNGRMTRALTDQALAQADARSIRLYAMSSAILQHRKGYYQILETTQRGDLDITDWLVWFCSILQETLQTALNNVDQTIAKTRFWRKHQMTPLLPDHIKMLNRLLDGEFLDGINAAKYQAVTKVSKPTATRHLADLVEKGCLTKLAGGGRNTRYALLII